MTTRRFTTVNALGVLLAACSPEGDLPSRGAEPTTPSFSLAQQPSEGELKHGHLNGEPITYRELDGQAYFHGDIKVIPDEMLPAAHDEDGNPLERAAAIREWGRWPNNVIAYVIDPDVPSQRVNGALYRWSGRTNVRWVARTDEPEYVRFRKADRCQSAIGQTFEAAYPQGQAIDVRTDIPDFCEERDLAHEIGHAMGLFHEHTREDRDNFVEILWDVIKPECHDQYYVYHGRGADYGIDLGVFDFGSTMIYPSVTSCQTDGLSTMWKKSDGTSWTKNEWPSAGDYAAINRMYPNWVVGTQKASDIGAGPGGAVFIISDTPNGSGDYLVKRWNATTQAWQTFNNGAGLKIDVDRNGRPWVVTSAGIVKRWTGSTWADVGTSSLRYVEDIAIGPGGGGNGTAFALSRQEMVPSLSGINPDVANDFTLWKFNNTAGRWDKQSGGGIRLSVDNAASNQPWVVTSDNNLFRRTATGWVYESMCYTASDVGVGSGGAVFTVGGSVRAKVRSAAVAPGVDKFFNVSSEISAVAVDTDSSGKAWVVTYGGTVRRMN